MKIELPRHEELGCLQLRLFGGLVLSQLRASGLKLEASKPKGLRRGRALCEAAGHDEDHGLGLRAWALGFGLWGFDHDEDHGLGGCIVALGVVRAARVCGTV